VRRGIGTELSEEPHALRHVGSSGSLCNEGCRCGADGDGRKRGGGEPFPSGGSRGAPQCRQCGEGKGEVDVLTIPYVFQYLSNELAAMNISTSLGTRPKLG
jgi:hypothetical protein